MKLYSGPLSLFSAKARIALGEKGLPHDLLQVGWSRKAAYAPHHPEVLRLNPKGQVPVLVDGEVVVYDSTLIFEYLEERAPEPRLFPKDLAERARCRQQEAAADEIWFPQVWKLIEARVYGTGVAGDAEAATHELHRLYGAFDAALGRGTFYCGDFSVADVGSFVFAHAAATLGAPIPARLQHMQAWRERMLERPPVARVMADMNEFAAKALAG